MSANWGGRPVPFPASAAFAVRLAPQPGLPAPIVIPRAEISAVERLTAGRRGRAEVEEALRRVPQAARVVAVVGVAGSGRSTVAAELAVVAASYQPGPVIVVDASGSVWPGARCRFPPTSGSDLDWLRIRPLLARQDRVPALGAFVHCVRHVEYRREVNGSEGWVTRLGGVPPSRPWEPVRPAEVLATVEAVRGLSRMTVVDCPADTDAVTRVCATVANVLVVVCRADAAEVRRCGQLVEVLSRDVRRDLTRRSVIVPVQHRPGRWPRAAAAAEAAAGRAVTAVRRLPFNRTLVDASTPVTHGVTAAKRLTAAVVLLSAQQL
ncbi:hypothetical protein [Actinosynnema sp. NPDC023587]|uniref:hypothetical protein n=1 Tax=Actinosynnema sp. NPDC023587 TaxID=3154695 RepID=UPI0033FAF4E4